MGSLCSTVVLVFICFGSLCLAEEGNKKCSFDGFKTIGRINLLRKDDDQSSKYAVLNLSAVPCHFISMADGDSSNHFSRSTCENFTKDVSVLSSCIIKTQSQLISLFVNCSSNDISGCTMYYDPIPDTEEKHPSEKRNPASFVTLTAEYESLPDCRKCCAVKNNHHRALKVGLGVGGGFLTLISIAAIMVFCYRRRRRTWLLRISTSSSIEALTKEDVQSGIDYVGVAVFTYPELEAATRNFSAENELGEGGFGTVYYGKLSDGREVAVKRMYEHSYRRVAQFVNEITILTKIRHRYLVSLYGCTSRRSRELLLVYEFVSNGTVFDHLHGNRAKHSKLTWGIRMKIAVETASALTYLHASDIIHRDVKTHNILLDENFCVKVADFGLSRLFPVDRTHVSTAPQGTPGYVDPEYHQTYQLTDKSDVYSFGVVLIELVSSLPAVDITRDWSEINLGYLALKRVQKRAYDELIDHTLGYGTNEEVTRMSVAVSDLAFKCVQVDKLMRPSMTEVLEELVRIQNNGADNRSSPLNSGESPLIKNAMIPTSPTSVIGKWTSSRTSAASSSIGSTLKD